MDFPEDFHFCAATASYQIEGGWNADGKGENIWDQLTHTKPELFPDKTNGDVACDSYHKYKEDVSLLKDIGFGMYRFSISWARVLPTGDITNINEAGIKYYQNLIDELHNNHIKPMVCMYHWDLPQKLQDMGGWTNPLIVDYFEDYVNLLFKHFAKKVEWWITINQPLSVILGYTGFRFAPDLNLDSSVAFTVAHNLLKAHGRAYRLYEKSYKDQQKGKISISLCFHFGVPKTQSKEDIEAADRARQFTYGWFAHPIFSKTGDYPEIMRRTIDENSRKEGRSRSRLPKFTSDEIRAIKGSADFFAVNHYSAVYHSPGNHAISFLKDSNAKIEVDPSWPTAAADWLKVGYNVKSVYPEGFRQLLLWIKKEYDNVPVFVTENGYCDKSGVLDDNARISYYHSYLQKLLQAMHEDKCNIIGYTVWTLMDNFEWLDGYKKVFGIVHVDFNDPERKRTKKKSASFFQELFRTKVLPKIQN